MFSREDLEKAASREMEIFNLVEKEYPPLEKYRNKIFEQFFKHYHAINEYVIRLHDGLLYRHSFIINGAILRSLNYYRGALWALGTRNSHVFYDCARAQCETLALIHYCVLKPEYIKAATIGERGHEKEGLRVVNVLTMIDKLDRKHKNIRKDYDDLCNFVHPNPRSLYANVKPINKKEGELVVEISTKCTRINNKVAELYIKILINWTDWFFDELSDLVKILKPT